MAKLLHIDASPRGDCEASRRHRSHSRRLTREFVEAWKKANPIDTIIYRDLGRNPIPHVTEAWIAAACTPEKERSIAPNETNSRSWIFSSEQNFKAQKFGIKLKAYTKVRNSKFWY